MMSTKSSNCCSGVFRDGQTNCCSRDSADSTIRIDFLYIDLTTCDRCLDTDTSLTEAIHEVENLLKSAGHTIELRKILVETEDRAEQLGFVSSPTIRINGCDIQLQTKESLCGCCGEIAGEDIDCRVWVWKEQEYTTPPKAMLIDAILRHVYGKGQGDRTKHTVNPVPDNLKRFFKGKLRKNSNRELE